MCIRDNLHINAGVVPAQHLQRLGQQVRNGARGRAQPHTPLQPLHLAQHQVHGLIGIGQQAPRPLHQHLPCAGRPHLAPLAHQQRRTNQRLQVRNVQADRGRRQVQRAGRFGKRPEVSDGDQGAQPVEIEFCLLYTSRCV